MLPPARQQEHQMPPQQTNLISETGRDAAGLHLDLAIASAKDATGDASAAVSPGPSVAAPADAFPEEEAAGPPAASTRSVSGLLLRYWRAFWERRRHERLRVGLYDLSDRELMDIGLTSTNIDYIAARRAIERLRDGTMYLWPSRGGK
jgi:uncharacterized protein YjiS (DUF1127 family)